MQKTTKTPCEKKWLAGDTVRAAGKPHKVIITAVAKKLVTIANALCKSRQKWAPHTT